MRRWKTVIGAVVLAAAAALGDVGTAQAQPALVAAKDFSKPAIVILGYGLNDNGTMRPILRRRVLTGGLTVAQFFPQSPIIVTGGNPPAAATPRPARCGRC